MRKPPRRKRTFSLTSTKSYEQSTDTCDICYEEDFLSKCYRCTITICSTCAKKITKTKNECPVCKLVPWTYVYTNVEMYDRSKNNILEKKRLAEVVAEHKILFEEEARKAVVATTKRQDPNSLIYDIRLVREIKNKHVNFDIKTICDIIDTRY